MVFLPMRLNIQAKEDRHEKIHRPEDYGGLKIAPAERLKPLKQKSDQVRSLPITYIQTRLGHDPPTITLNVLPT